MDNMLRNETRGCFEPVKKVRYLRTLDVHVRITYPKVIISNEVGNIQANGWTYYVLLFSLAG